MDLIIFTEEILNGRLYFFVQLGRDKKRGGATNEIRGL